MLLLPSQTLIEADFFKKQQNSTYLRGNKEKVSLVCLPENTGSRMKLRDSRAILSDLSENW